MKRIVQGIKELAKKSYTLRRIVKKYRLKHNQPAWDKIIAQDKEIWSSALAGAKNKRVLVATSVGSHLAGTTMESLLSVALTLRGARTDILLCDSALPACFASWVGLHKSTEEFASHGPAKDLCSYCFFPADEMFKQLGLKIHHYGGYLDRDDIEKAEQIVSSTPYLEIEGFKLNGMNIGEHAMAGTLRFFSRGDLGGEPYAEQILRRYFKAAILTAFSVSKLLDQIEYDVVVFNHGIYVPQGIIGDVCRHKGIRVVNWNPAYRKKCFIFSNVDTYHHTMITENTDKWKDLDWNDELEADLSRYLRSRWRGTNDWIWFHERPEFNIDKISEQSGIDFSKPSIGLLTSVSWDAQLHYDSNAFSNMFDWISKTINYFIKRPDLQLIIRVHPAEVRGTLPSRQKIIDQIAREYKELPSNIIIIPPESNISTYQVMMHCNSVIIYNTKTGVELSAVGVPVIVTGEAWIRNKGFSIDVSSPAEYYAVLDKLPFKNRSSEDKILLAKKYAYHFFFRRMIPVECMEPTGGDPPYRIKISGLADLKSGVCTGLDVICNGILNGGDFIYKAEEVTVNNARC